MEKTKESEEKTFDQRMLAEVIEGLDKIVSKDEYAVNLRGYMFVPVYADPIDKGVVAPGCMVSVNKGLEGPSAVIRSVDTITDFTRKFVSSHYTQVVNLLNEHLEKSSGSPSGKDTDGEDEGA